MSIYLPVNTIAGTAWAAATALSYAALHVRTLRAQHAMALARFHSLAVKQQYIVAFECLTCGLNRDTVRGLLT